MTIETGSEGAFDTVVVGAGVAGALTALQLARGGQRVALLESGERFDRSELAAAMRSDPARDPSTPYQRWPWAPIPGGHGVPPAAAFGDTGDGAYAARYVRGVGGSTWLWTGSTPRLLPVDFRLHETYGVGVDWPLTYADLEPYYRRAEQALGVAGDDNDDGGSPRSGPFPHPPFPLSFSDRVLGEHLAAAGIRLSAAPAARLSRPAGSRPACCGSNSCTPVCPVGAKYDASIDVDAAVAAGARLLTRATACSFSIDRDSQRITAVRYRLPDRSERTIQARNVVLACNGIETPRLLLMAAGPDAPAGVANATGQVGRHFMDHALLLTRFRMPVPVYGGRGPQSGAGLSVGRDGAFRKTHAAIRFFTNSDIPLADLAVRHTESAGDPATVIDSLRREFIRYASIGGEVEQLPVASNRIELDSGRADPLGLPAVRVVMHTDPYTARAVEAWSGFLAATATRIGATHFSVDRAWQANHPSGAARMGSDPASSVVDANCRSHQHANLFVVGSAVFPTIGTANPTLTIAALALRLAEHLLKAGPRIAKTVAADL